MHILSIGFRLCIIVNISCMYIMSVLNVPTRANEFISSFLPSIKCWYITGYTDAIIRPYSAQTR